MFLNCSQIGNLHVALSHAKDRELHNIDWLGRVAKRCCLFRVKSNRQKAFSMLTVDIIMLYLAPPFKLLQVVVMRVNLEALVYSA